MRCGNVAVANACSVFDASLGLSMTGPLATGSAFGQTSPSHRPLCFVALGRSFADETALWFMESFVVGCVT